MENPKVIKIRFSILSPEIFSSVNISSISFKSNAKENVISDLVKQLLANVTVDKEVDLGEATDADEIYDVMVLRVSKDYNVLKSASNDIRTLKIKSAERIPYRQGVSSKVKCNSSLTDNSPTFSSSVWGFNHTEPRWIPDEVLFLDAVIDSLSMSMMRSTSFVDRKVETHSAVRLRFSILNPEVDKTKLNVIVTSVERDMTEENVDSKIAEILPYIQKQQDFDNAAQYSRTIDVELLRTSKDYLILDKRIDSTVLKSLVMSKFFPMNTILQASNSELQCIADSMIHVWQTDQTVLKSTLTQIAQLIKVGEKDAIN